VITTHLCAEQRRVPRSTLFNDEAIEPRSAAQSITDSSQSGDDARVDLRSATQPTTTRSDYFMAVSRRHRVQHITTLRHN